MEPVFPRIFQIPQTNAVTVDYTLIGLIDTSDSMFYTFGLLAEEWNAFTKDLTNKYVIAFSTSQYLIKNANLNTWPLTYGC